MQSWADCITGTHESSFWKRQRTIAAGIPGAKFVALESRNHMVLEGEPAWNRLLDAIMTFLRA